MATFYTATQEARKAGFTHMTASNEQTTPLDTVQKGASPKGYKRNGWHFANLHNIGQCILYMDCPGRVMGWYELKKETP